MENLSVIDKPIETKCPSCSMIPNETDAFCQQCGYPLKGTEMEQKTFMIDKEYKHVELDELNEATKNQKILYGYCQ
ncbi:hypothetical protein NF867_12995 [Solitalea sp. MAHUQ-68]|uniref:Zinc-ribbon domain-containing protein n=1 Tax=Solitalea agri TaxID=2953739 RepID=A0A9X2JCR8_9SPHI|nr:hypothetical protein [Solitalea agri]MCO4293782.1 hypothetical protein [Solitalea agri]